MTPSDEQECRDMLYTGHLLNGPAAVRYPRGVGSGKAVDAQVMTQLSLGKARVVSEGKELAILCFGTLLQQAIPVAEKLGATLIDMRFVKPLDTTLIKQLSESHQHFVTIEENSIAGGAGSGVNEYLQAQRINRPVLNIGLPDRFIEQGTQPEIYHMLQLDSEGIEQQIAEYYNNN